MTSMATTTAASKELPYPLPSWISQLNEHGEMYYINTVTGTSQWEKPVDYNPIDYNPTPVDYNPTPVGYNPTAATFNPTSNYGYNNPSPSGTPNPQYVPQYDTTPATTPAPTPTNPICFKCNGTGEVDCSGLNQMRSRYFSTALKSALPTTGKCQHCHGTGSFVKQSQNQYSGTGNSSTSTMYSTTDSSNAHGPTSGNHEKDCWRCRGKGYIQCGRCGGSGYPHHNSDVGSKLCQTCNGSGVYNDCSTCHGSGKLNTSHKINEACDAAYRKGYNAALAYCNHNCQKCNDTKKETENNGQQFANKSLIDAEILRLQQVLVGLNAFDDGIAQSSTASSTATFSTATSTGRKAQSQTHGEQPVYGTQKMVRSFVKGVNDVGWVLMTHPEQRTYNDILARIKSSRTGLIRLQNNPKKKYEIHQEYLAAANEVFQQVALELVQLGTTIQKKRGYPNRINSALRSPELFVEKISLPLKEYPNKNWMGIIIGRGGQRIKEYREKSGATVCMRGRGSQRGGQQKSSLPLHVVIKGKTKSQVAKAKHCVQWYIDQETKGTREATHVGAKTKQGGTPAFTPGSPSQSQNQLQHQHPRHKQSRPGARERRTEKRKKKQQEGRRDAAAHAAAGVAAGAAAVGGTAAVGGAVDE